MDFLGSYIPSSTTAFTPKANRNKFDDLPALRVPCDDEQLKKMKSGNYDDVRKIRSVLEKKKSAVQFIAPLCEEGDSLQSIKLTPRVVRTAEDNFKTPPPGPFGSRDVEATSTDSDKSGSKQRKRDKPKSNSSYFRFNFRRSLSQPDIDP